jgi:hypothetical protein
MNANPSTTDNSTVSDRPIFDPFPEPRAYPSGWDLSGFESPSSLPSATETDAPAES